MNKDRLLKLIEILKTKTDYNHKLSINELIDLLGQDSIVVNNRKTLYDDFKTLSQYGYEVEYDNGYYLIDAPFSLSEVKIILDSLNSLKNLDNNLLDRLTNKLYSFVSDYETKLLKKLEYRNKHSDKKFINRLEDTLSAIGENKTLIIKRNNKQEEEEIGPLFLYRQNDYYYLYYHYVGSDKIYHTRFDNVISMKLTQNVDDINIQKNKIIDIIDESSNAFYGSKTKTINIEIINNSEYIKSRLMDDFPNGILTKNGCSIKASVSNAFFGKLCSYGTDIKISDKTIANQYTTYLKSIITQNK